jgi:hypothetical protein
MGEEDEKENVQKSYSVMLSCFSSLHWDGSLCTGKISG